MATVAISLAVSVGLNALSRELFDDESDDEILDDKPTQIAKRGTFVPLIIGRRRTPGVFGWAGDRLSLTFESEEGGKSSDTFTSVLGVEKPKKTNHYEDAWHLICVGPVEKLITIRVNGKPILADPFTRLGTPSGSFFQTDNGSIDHEEGIFNVTYQYRGFLFWGENDQPVNEPPLFDALSLPKRLGIASRWPHMHYIHWIRFSKGMDTNWPFIDYEVVVEPISTDLTMSPKFLDETVPDKGDEGANPAHALWQILTEPFPHGCGIDKNRLNQDAFELFGQIAEDEHLPVNISAANGRDAVQIISELMQDMGAMFPQIGKEVFPFLVRPQINPVPDFTDDVIVPPLPEFTTLHGNIDIDRMIFTYKDLKNNYRDVDIQIDDDGAADARGAFKTKKIPIKTVTDFDTAQKVAERRQAEELGRAKLFKISATRGARVLRAGNVIDVTGIGRLLILSNTLTDNSNVVELECAIDAYSLTPSTFDQGAPTVDPIATPAVPDTVFTFIETPRQINTQPGGGMSIMVARVRARTDIIGARIHGSPTGATFEQIGAQDAHAIGGRIITDPFGADFDGGQMIVEDGPLFTVNDVEKDDLLVGIRDFSADEDSWRNGRQVALIDDEILFLRNITTISANVFQLNGLIRARFDTDRQTHAINQRIFIFTLDNLSKLSDVMVREGATLSIKSQPRALTSIVSLGAITPVTKTLTGLTVSPMRTDNFRGNDDDAGREENRYVAGADIRFDWNFKVADGFGSAAGEKLAGEIIADDPPVPEGFFVIQIIDTAGPTVVRTIEIGKTAAPFDTVIYTNAELVADFGGEPASFEASLRNVNGSRRSAEREITITKL